MDTVRTTILRLAKAKYIATGITKNITIALALYLKNDAAADEQIPIHITTPDLHRLTQALKFSRPKCDYCGADLYMQSDAVDQAGKKHPTAWHCKSCGIIYYSDMTPQQWLEEIRRETRQQHLSARDKSIK